MKKITAILLALVTLLALVSCGSTPAATETTAPVQNTEAPVDNTTEAAATEAPATEAPKETTAAAVVTEAPAETTAGEPEYGENEFGTLSEDKIAAYKDILPALLPDNSIIEKWARPLCLDETFDSENFGNHYQLAGNSTTAANQTKYVTVEEGAIYGLGLNISSYGQNTEKRAEVTVTPYESVNVKGAKGILFWVDFSHTDIQTDTSKKYQYCASVTINTNDYRSNIENSGSKGYYYDNGTWVETKNINACRMELPNQFKGWVYVPATSYIKSADKTSIADADGTFIDLDVTNVRLYTDGYVYTDAADKYIIFDEILFVY